MKSGFTFREHFLRAGLLMTVCWIAVSRMDAADGPSDAVDPSLSFETAVRPILKAYCLDCHGGAEKLSGGLDLRLKRFLVAGGDSGPAIDLTHPEASLLLQRISSGEMPPGEKKVPAEKQQVIARWIAAGAVTAREEPAALEPGIGITSEERAYWAFQPIQRPDTPSVKAADRVRSPIDSFVIARLEAHGLQLNPDADRLTLLKRAYFDLIGLPPTEEEAVAFLNDPSERAYEALIDRLLESPHYGERWGRHWLDVAGYAESEGDGSVDTARPYIYKYRDYVIRSINADKPLDRFIIEQLAGDELAPPTQEDRTPAALELLVATGFLRSAADPTASGQGEPDASRNQVMADTIKIVSSSLLGLSVGCAQCHDHRYDPIPQTDYFRLRAIFEPALNHKAWVIPRDRVISLYTAADRAKAAEVEMEAGKLQQAYNEKQSRYVEEAFLKALEKFPAEQREALRVAFQTPADKRTDEQKQLVDSNPGLKVDPGVLYQFNAGAAEELKKDAAAIAAKRQEKPVEDFISVLTEPSGEPPVTQVFYRGDYRQPTTAVKPGDLTIAAPEGSRFDIADRNPALPTSGRRLVWAQHLVDGKHPLLGRVLANRIWLNHFGRGIVETPGEFGILGTRPTHPELLDWLAAELPRTGWSLKQMHRLLMTSSVYRQSSERNVASAVDTDGSLYSRFSVKRLEAEIVRDRMLAAAGRLDRTPFGPSIPVIEDFAGQVHVKDDSPRRSVYIEVRRSKPVSLLTAFDAPVMAVNCDRRSSSTVAPQSLMLMNGEFTLKQADHFAQRAQGETPSDAERQLAEQFNPRFVTHPSAWQYGFGFIDESPAADKTVAAVHFQPLGHWTGSQWQAGTALPDPVHGWPLLHASGGHPGNAKHATIRRWTAPRHGVIQISGSLKHLSESGDGVRGRIYHSRNGGLGAWIAKANQTDTGVARIEVEAGDQIDFVTECQQDETSDSFEWTVTLRMSDAGNGDSETWESAADFRGPRLSTLPEQIVRAWKLAYCRPITPDELEIACQFCESQLLTLRRDQIKGDHERIVLTNLCQQLLSSNEFLYVD